RSALVTGRTPGPAWAPLPVTRTVAPVMGSSPSGRQRNAYVPSPRDTDIALVVPDPMPSTSPNTAPEDGSRRSASATNTPVLWSRNVCVPPCGALQPTPHASADTCTVVPAAARSGGSPPEETSATVTATALTPAMTPSGHANRRASRAPDAGQVNGPSRMF